jgi:hypothetical protein
VRVRFIGEFGWGVQDGKGESTGFDWFGASSGLTCMIYTIMCLFIKCTGNIKHSKLQQQILDFLGTGCTSITALANM